MKVAVFSAKSYEREFLDRFNKDGKHELVYLTASLDANTTNLAIGFRAISIFVTDKIDAEVIEKLAKIGVELIDLRSAGFNNVDIAAAQKFGIKVVRVPAYSPQAIAEHAVALILTLNRKTHKAYNRVRESNFSLNGLMGFNLYQKTVGVIGTGKIGEAFCKIMLGFGCKVIAFDITPSETLKKNGVDYKPFNEVLQQSDIISLHCPLTPKTHYLLNSQTFAQMKNGVMLINTSRGAIIKTDDAIVALKNEKLGFLGIDVYEEEDNLFFKDLSDSIIQDDVIERLMAFYNVLITPHQGFLTEEALEHISETTIKNLSDFQNKLPLVNEVKIN